MEIILFIIWVCITFIINPIGNFPLNDDWAYYRTVETLLNKGIYAPENWPAMTLIAHVYWGYFVSAILGYSFTILRISTILMGFIGVVVFYKLIFKYNPNKFAAFLGALLLTANPLYLNLYFTFMTDIPFIVTILFALLFYFKFLETGEIKLLIIAVIITIVSVLTRQLALLLPLSFGIIYFVTNQKKIKQIFIAILPFLITFISLQIFSWWLNKSGRMPDNYEKVGGITKAFLAQFDRHVFNDLIVRLGDPLRFCGYFLSPLIIIIAPGALKKMVQNKQIAILSISAVFSISYLIVYLANFNIYNFLPGNMVFNLGVGPQTLKDSYILKQNLDPVLSNSVSLMFSIIGIVLQFVLVCLLLNALVKIVKQTKQKIKEPNQKIISYALLFLILYSYFIYMSISYLDRYFLINTVFIILILCVCYKDSFSPGKVLKWTANLFLVFIVFFSFASTHDYLSWNRVRWETIRELEKEKKITPHYIDGGFEYNGYYRPGTLKYDSISSWWWVDRDDYVIAFGNIKGYKTIKSRNYPQLIPTNQNKICILEKETTPKSNHEIK